MTTTDRSVPNDDALAQRVAELEATVERLTQTLDDRAPTPPPSSTPVGPEPTNAEVPAQGESVDRRRLLTRAGTAAVGAVIGGAVATVAGASPAAAATGTFDTTDGTPALTATTTSTGPAIRATTTSTGKAAELDGRVTITGPDDLLRIESHHPDGFGQPAVWVESDTLGAFIKGASGVFALGAGMGVQAVSDVVGLSATGGLVGVVAEGQRAQLVLGRYEHQPSAPPSSVDEHEAGEVVFDIDENLWLCVAEGTPGTWVRLAGPGTAGAFTVLPAPVRVYDSRPGATPTDVGPKTQLTAFQPRQGIALTTNTSGVPTDATAATISVTVANTAGGSPTSPGYLTVYPSDTSWPGTSNLNWTTPDAITAVTTTVGLGPDATIAAYASHACDLIIDVIGYHR